HSLLLKQPRQGVVVGKRGNLRPESRRRLRPRVTLLLRERALDRRALRRDLLDVTLPHLLEEERAVRNADAGRRLSRPRAKVEVQDQKREGEEDPPGARAKAGLLRRRRRRSARRRRRTRILLLVRALCRHHSRVMIPTSHED